MLIKKLYIHKYFIFYLYKIYTDDRQDIIWFNGTNLILYKKLWRRI